MQRATDRSSRRETAGIQLNSKQPRPAPESLMSANPRRIFALEGGVEEGDAADFTVLDLGAEYAVDPGTFLSKGRATPFAGWKVQGRAVLTVVGGKEVYDDNYESNR